MDHVISVFSGAGGLSLGFARAGLKPVVGIDINADACRTYERNLGIRARRLDLGIVDQDSLVRTLDEYVDPFAIIGGPPCQGFSTAGSRSASDPRNSLIFNYLALVQ